MPLPDDVADYLARRFPGGDQVKAGGLLDAAVLHDGSRPGPRLLRCAAVASGGSLARLGQLIDLLQVDYRDVIMAGEYEWDGQKSFQVRDLHQPIAADA